MPSSDNAQVAKRKGAGVVCAKVCLGTATVPGICLTAFPEASLSGLRVLS